MSDNVSGLGLTQGFMQGFQFMEGIEDRKQQRALVDRQEQRAAESHGLQMASTNQTMRYANEEREYKQGERKRVDDARLIQAVKAGFETGNPDPEMMQEYADRFDVDWSNYVNPEFGASLDVLKGAVSGQGNYTMRSPEVVNAFNTVYRKEIQKGVGEKIERDGKKYTITGKRAAALVPGNQEGTFMVGLKVTAEDEKGNKIEYDAPVTEGRSSTDEFVKSIELDKAMEQLAGHDMIYRGVNNSPELQSLFNQRLVRLGALQPGKDADKRHVINGKLVDNNGKVLGDFGNKSERPFVIDGKLVDASGKVIGDYGDPDKNKWGEVIQHPTLGPVQVGPGGQLKQFNGGKGGKGGGAGGDSLDSSEMSQIRQVSGSFHGSMSPDGNSFIMPEGTNVNYVTSMERAEELRMKGLPIFKAIRIANLSTLRDMPNTTALKIARTAAINGTIEDSDEKIEEYAKMLQAEHKTARQLYEQYAGGSGAPQQGAGLQTVQPQQPQQQAAAPAAQPKQAPQKPSGKKQRDQYFFTTAEGERKPVPDKPPRGIKPPPQEAINDLLADPSLAKEFVEHYQFLPENF